MAPGYHGQRSVLPGADQDAAATDLGASLDDRFGLAGASDSRADSAAFSEKLLLLNKDQAGKAPRAGPGRYPGPGGSTATLAAGYGGRIGEDAAASGQGRAAAEQEGKAERAEIREEDMLAAPRDLVGSQESLTVNQPS